METSLIYTNWVATSRRENQHSIGEDGHSAWRIIRHSSSSGKSNTLVGEWTRGRIDAQGEEKINTPEGGSTLRIEYGHSEGWLSTGPEGESTLPKGGSTLEKDDQLFGGRIDHNVWFKGPSKRGHIVADTNVSPFACACNICCGHKFCVQDVHKKCFWFCSETFWVSYLNEV